MNNIFKLIDKLESSHSLSLEEYQYLIGNQSNEVQNYISEKARKITNSIYGNKIFIRGLIEISNICKNDCYYCGIRKSNTTCSRYRLNEDDILSAAKEGYSLGFKTFVLQGGEDLYFSDYVLSSIIKKIKNLYPDVAITLSLGERNFDSYKKLFDAGADRYLLRHETADEEHYQKLHPNNMSFENRITCLKNLKEIGYQVGAGFMVGSPYQTSISLAKDLKFIEEFKPDMCGIGPFIPHKDTSFKNEPAGTVDQTCYLFSIIRLIHPSILLPATTALSSIDPDGHEKGILSGANVVMPNLSPISVRGKYELYNNKAYSGTESAQNKKDLEEKFKKIGYEIIISRGDIKK